MRKGNLIKRLSWYYPTELFNVFLFSGVMIYVLISYPIVNTVFLLYGLFVMIYILYQGQHYWKLKLYRLTQKQFDEQKSIDFFKKAKKMNGYLILFIPVIFLLQFFLSKMRIGSANLIGWAVAANIFAMLEHINYYYKQLMVDNISDVNYIKRNKKLKIASLAKDLKENKL